MLAIVFERRTPLNNVAFLTQCHCISKRHTKSLNAHPHMRDNGSRSQPNVRNATLPKWFTYAQMLEHVARFLFVFIIVFIFAVKYSRIQAQPERQKGTLGRITHVACGWWWWWWWYVLYMFVEPLELALRFSREPKFYWPSNARPAHENNVQFIYHSV